MAVTKLIVDPELEDWLPPIEADELHQLRANLERDGCRDAILHWRGKVIDGFNRFALCEELGIPYIVKELKFEDIGAVKRWMFENQSGRRNWTESQRAMIAAKLDDVRGISSVSSGKANTNDSVVPQEHLSQREKARKHGVSRPSVNRAESVLKAGVPELVEAVTAGRVELKQAAKIAKLPKSRQRQTLKREQTTAPIPKPKDETGEEVPTDLIDTFAAREKFDDCLNHLTTIAKIINPYLGDPRNNVLALSGGECLAKQRIESAMSELRACIRFAKPYALCPDHSGAKCLRCGGRRWMTKETFDRCGVK